MEDTKQQRFIAKLDHYRNLTTWMNFWQNYYEEFSFGKRLQEVGEGLFQRYHDLETKVMTEFILTLSDKEVDEWEARLKKVEKEQQVGRLLVRMKTAI
jgi:hypothetical protein